ncbi:2-amino-4-hydroxy-6-hydroxymethyldihydropteridine diphosphokinase [Asticcacaulis sp. BYS171W]|uniref:2-amino-4-hydroxy-6-hydroxymethyldihydropteridine pyrophosphokinase n=1 Tax=Asticcacaulis aquaticus TaxID=2984212 RepID=A0ABT5HPD5_9CAUL|nr:2-amino-4-hydroxy-6-hydroxymethyldihydropteridine diphosphokinase [Asticcacaulis aquaticus]MDC7681925.1 2-amino-4-hydroxy-6-hydroxymethyldihydropteridine diphosphokinase [Asticcacaulis aquaticus]
MPDKIHKSHTETSRRGQGVFVAFGSNISFGDYTALQLLDHVVKRLNRAHVTVEQVSRLWRSQAWPNPEDPEFHNAVMRVTTDCDPIALLGVLHAVESETGRVRSNDYANVINVPANAPRVLDLDLIAFDDHRSEDGLILPHPRAHERGFVMGPLSEIAPDWVHPVLKRTARELFAQVTVATDAYPAEETAGLLGR